MRTRGSYVVGSGQYDLAGLLQSTGMRRASSTPSSATIWPAWTGVMRRPCWPSYPASDASSSKRGVQRFASSWAAPSFLVGPRTCPQDCGAEQLTRRKRRTAPGQSMLPRPKGGSELLARREPKGEASNRCCAGCRLSGQQGRFFPPTVRG